MHDDISSAHPATSQDGVPWHTENISARITQTGQEKMVAVYERSRAEVRTDLDRDNPAFPP